MRQQCIRIGAILFSLIILFSCKKKEDDKTISGNQAPYYDEIPTLLVRNYVNRLYIDLIGREPLDVEMDNEVDFLRENSLSMESRDSLIERLQHDTHFIEGDSSYRAAYYQRFYELSKSRLLEGASNAVIQQEMGMLENNILRDSIAGNLLSLEINMEKLNKLKKVISLKTEYENGLITLSEVFTRLLDNAIYDEINMNTFNFVRASFNDLFYRFPTQREFDLGFSMIEYNHPEILFGQAGQSKSDYIEILVNSQEFFEGIVRWMYQTLLSREPDTKEVYQHMTNFINDYDLQKVQKNILKTDEYANFL